VACARAPASSTPPAGTAPPSATLTATATVAPASTTSATTARPIALLIGARGPRRDELAAQALARARTLGFDARDYRAEYGRWASSDLFYGNVGEPPRWVSPEIAERWRKEGAACPPMPTRGSPAWSEDAADAAYDCTQKLLVALREVDLARQRPEVIFGVAAGPEGEHFKPTGQWHAEAFAGRADEPCARSLGAGAESPILIPMRDAETPKDEECAIATAVRLAERLLKGDAATVVTRGGLGLRVMPRACPTEVHVDVAERERKKTPERVCAP
jgi:hypothetical protein